ncbi:unnamed protein product [Durusdinium trenchii]|uniref:N-acetyltransferase domain-containing protein n=1 Tax=Durusdinium trenchii TaxID=1381693 RepID=A0ABP0MTP1_9DINO
MEFLDAPSWRLRVTEFRHTARGVMGGIMEASRESKLPKDETLELPNPAPALQLKHPHWRLLRLVLHDAGPPPLGAKPVPVAFFSVVPEPLISKTKEDVVVRLATHYDRTNWQELFSEYRKTQIPGGSPPFVEADVAAEAVWHLFAHGGECKTHRWRAQLLVAYSGSTLLGAAHLVLQPRDAGDTESWRGFLNDIFVSPAATGKGIGRAAPHQ